MPWAVHSCEDSGGLHCFPWHPHGLHAVCAVDSCVVSCVDNHVDSYGHTAPLGPMWVFTPLHSPRQGLSSTAEPVQISVHLCPSARLHSWS